MTARNAGGGMGRRAPGRGPELPPWSRDLLRVLLGATSAGLLGVILGLFNIYVLQPERPHGWSSVVAVLIVYFSLWAGCFIALYIADRIARAVFSAWWNRRHRR